MTPKYRAAIIKVRQWLRARSRRGAARRAPETRLRVRSDTGNLGIGWRSQLWAGIVAYGWTALSTADGYRPARVARAVGAHTGEDDGRLRFAAWMPEGVRDWVLVVGQDVSPVVGLTSIDHGKPHVSPGCAASGLRPDVPVLLAELRNGSKTVRWLERSPEPPTARVSPASALASAG